MDVAAVVAAPAGEIQSPVLARTSQRNVQRGGALWTQRGITDLEALHGHVRAVGEQLGRGGVARGGGGIQRGAPCAGELPHQAAGETGARRVVVRARRADALLLSLRPFQVTVRRRVLRRQTSQDARHRCGTKPPSLAPRNPRRGTADPSCRANPPGRGVHRQRTESHLANRVPTSPPGSSSAWYTGSARRADAHRQSGHVYLPVAVEIQAGPVHVDGHTRLGAGCRTRFRSADGQTPKPHTDGGEPQRTATQLLAEFAISRGWRRFLRA